MVSGLLLEWANRLLTPEFDNLAHSEMLMEFQGEIEKRLMLEMKVLDQLLESPHGLISNRYGKTDLTICANFTVHV